MNFFESAGIIAAIGFTVLLTLAVLSIIQERKNNKNEQD